MSKELRKAEEELRNLFTIRNFIVGRYLDEVNDPDTLIHIVISDTNKSIKHLKERIKELKSNVV